MTAVIVRHLDSAGPVNGFANPVNQNETASRRVNVAEIKELVEASARLKEMPDDDIKKDARAAIKDGFRQARGLPPLKPRTPPKPKQPALAEPEEAARINDKLPAPAIEG
jgi:hypothetical protein